MPYIAYPKTNICQIQFVSKFIFLSLFFYVLCGNDLLNVYRFYNKIVLYCTIILFANKKKLNFEFLDTKCISVGNVRLKVCTQYYNNLFKGNHSYSQLLSQYTYMLLLM